MSVPWVSWRDEPSIVSETRLVWQRGGRGAVWAGGKTTPPLGDCGDVVDALAGWDRWREMNARIDRAVWKHEYAKGGVLPVDIGGPMPVAAVTGCSYLRPLPVNHDLLKKINEGHPF